MVAGGNDVQNNSEVKILYGRKYLSNPGFHVNVLMPCFIKPSDNFRLCSGSIPDLLEMLSNLVFPQRCLLLLSG